MNAATVAAALGRHTPKVGGGFMACCPVHDDRNPSLSINLSKDGKLLVRCMAGCNNAEVVSALKARNLWPDTLPPARKSITAQTWRPVLPIPNDAPGPPAAHQRHGTPSQVWRYLSPDGELLQLVCRFDLADGKQVLPLTFCTDGNRHEWRWQAIPENRPLYGLDRLGNAAHVVIAEGEKAADAARRLMGDRLPVVTWSGGCNAVAKADWSPLAGKSVAIWPDADAPGIKAALAVADCLAKIGATVKIAEPPADVAKGWDGADAEADGWDMGRVLALFKAGLTPGDFKARHGQGADEEKPVCGNSGSNDTHHDPPLLFDENNTPEISPDLLGGWLGAYVEAVARSTQTPPAMAVMLALSTVATCTAKRFEVAPYGEGYTEPLNLWTSTAMPPASRKTSVVESINSPLTEWERDQCRGMADEIRENNRIRSQLELRFDNLNRRAAKEDDPVKRGEFEREASQILAEMPHKIVAPRLWTGDTTPETLQGLLADHGERMAVLSDEGGIFEIMAGLYSDGKANLDIFLKGHAGSAVRVDRQGRTAHLDAPALSFGLAIQPAILADMATGGKRRFRGNGTLARFLYAVPRSNVGSRDVRAVYIIPATVEANYRAGIFNLLSAKPQREISLEGCEAGREVPTRLTLTPDALDNWLTFSQMVETRQGPDGDLHSISDWSGKLPGAALRIVGNLHVAKHGATPPAQIEASTIERALDLCDLLIDHAKAAFAMMEANPATTDAKAVFRWIEAERLECFKRGDLWAKFKGRFTGRTERLDRALKELEARHIVTPTNEPTKGRTVTIYTVNPAIWGTA